MNYTNSKNFKQNQKGQKKQNYYYYTSQNEKTGSRSRDYYDGYRSDYRNQDEYTFEKKEQDEIYVYKQDLYQIGFQCLESNKIEPSFEKLLEEYPECLNDTKRAVMLNEDMPDDKLEVSKEENIEEIKEDFQNLMENEDIPDWFIEPINQNNEFTFNFSDAIDRTNKFQQEVNIKQVIPQNFHRDSQIVNIHKSLEKTIQIPEQKPEPEILDKMNFEELDKYLEKKSKKDVIDWTCLKENTDVKFEDSASERSDSRKDSLNNSKDYFNNLEKNIKNMLFNSDQEDKEESEESFQEGLGFNYYDNKSTPKVIPVLNKTTKNTDSNINSKNLTTTVHNTHINKINIFNNMVPVEGNTFKKQTQEDIEGKKDEDKKDNVIGSNYLNNLTLEEQQRRKEVFKKKYGYLDPVLCQIVYEILNSKKRAVLNSHSIIGFNQKSVEKYCSNPYKIFSLLVQGNIIQKIWLYKDKMGYVQGPFMSYDMDIWNGEGNYFSPDLKISLNNKKFLPLYMYLNRDPQVISIVQGFMIDQSKKNTRFEKKQHRNKLFNKRPRGKRYKQQFKDPEVLEKDFNENFPALGKAPHENKPKKNPSLLETLTMETQQEEIVKIKKIKKNKKIMQNPQTAKIDQKLVKKVLYVKQEPVRDVVVNKQQKLEKPTKIKKKKNAEKNEELTSNLKNLLGL